VLHYQGSLSGCGQDLRGLQCTYCAVLFRTLDTTLLCTTRGVSHGSSSLLQVGIELHDGAIDGAEILATLMNSETLIGASCELIGIVATLSGKVNTRFDATNTEITRRFDATDADIKTGV